MEEINSSRLAVTEVEMKFHSQVKSLETQCSEHEHILSLKNQELKSLQMKINEIEQSTSYQIESLYKEKSEQERRYF